LDRGKKSSRGEGERSHGGKKNPDHYATNGGQKIECEGLPVGPEKKRGKARSKPKRTGQKKGVGSDIPVRQATGRGLGEKEGKWDWRGGSGGGIYNWHYKPAS